MTQLERFLSLHDFDEYMGQYESFCGLIMDGHTFRKEIDLMETDSTHTHREKESIREKKRRTHIKKLHMQIDALKAQIAEDGPWINPIEEETIEVVYHYPNDKKGDVDNYIAELYDPEQIGENVFAVAIPTDDLTIIDLIAFSSTRLFVDFDESDTNLPFLLRYNRIAQIEQLMWKVNYYKQDYRNLRTIPDIELRKMLTDYHGSITAYRDKIYEQLIAEGDTHPRWHSEQEAYRIVKVHYPDARFQYQPSFLRGQKLDIFIPSLNVAIEYQGKQHYEAIDFFGGKDGLMSNQERDNRKRRLCRMNGVKVVDWDYDKPLTNEYFVNVLEPMIVAGMRVKE